MAVDYELCCFLPISFKIFVLRHGGNFALHLSDYIELPVLAHVDAMFAASLSLGLYGTNNVGEHIISLCPHLPFLPLIRLQGDSFSCIIQLSRAGFGQRTIASDA